MLIFHCLEFSWFQNSLEKTQQNLPTSGTEDATGGLTGLGFHGKILPGSWEVFGGSLEVVFCFVLVFFWKKCCQKLSWKYPV